MHSKTAVQILTEARTLITPPGAWTQGLFARNVGGQLVDFMDPDAVCWCAAGARRRADEGCASVGDGQALAYLNMATPVGFAGLVGFNDDPKTTQADVVALFDRAISLATANV